jgi:hypothetical protein
MCSTFRIPPSIVQTKPLNLQTLARPTNFQIFPGNSHLGTRSQDQLTDQISLPTFPYFLPIPFHSIPFLPPRIMSFYPEIRGGVPQVTHVPHIPHNPQLSQEMQFTDPQIMQALQNPPSVIVPFPNVQAPIYQQPQGPDTRPKERLQSRLGIPPPAYGHRRTSTLTLDDPPPNNEPEQEENRGRYQTPLTFIRTSKKAPIDVRPFEIESSPTDRQAVRPTNQLPYKYATQWMRIYGNRITVEIAIDLFGLNIDQAFKLDNSYKYNYKPAIFKEWEPVCSIQGIIDFPRLQLDEQVFELIYPELDPDKKTPWLITLLNRPPQDEGVLYTDLTTLLRRARKRNSISGRQVSFPKNGNKILYDEFPNSSNDQVFASYNTDGTLNITYVDDELAIKIEAELQRKVPVSQRKPLDTDDDEADQEIPPAWAFEEPIDQQQNPLQLEIPLDPDYRRLPQLPPNHPDRQ